MKILTIHGYMGSAENAAYGALRALGADTVSPQLDYDSDTPENILEYLRKILDENPCDMIVGTSLGGFFALALAIERNMPAMTANPCLMPFLHLPQLGYKGDIGGFMRIFPIFSEIDKSRVYAVIGGRDEIINTHDFTKNIISRYDIVSEGLHSGRTLNLEYYFRKELERGGYI